MNLILPRTTIMYNFSTTLHVLRIASYLDTIKQDVPQGHLEKNHLETVTIFIQHKLSLSGILLLLKHIYQITMTQRPENQ